VAHGLRPEVERAALPAQNLEDGVARQEVFDARDLSHVEPSAVDDRSPEGLRRGASRRGRLGDALAGEHTAASHHFSEGVRVPVACGGGERDHDAASIEDELDPTLAPGELENPRLALLSNQLKDVGDAEVAKVSRKSDAQLEASPVPRDIAIDAA
jgi:hypothetical protein